MPTTKTFRLFISSTFSDFQEERTLLQTKVFPEIKEYAATKGYVFQPVDLRWGVSNEAQLDQKTLELCLSEVRACKTYPHPNFLVMLGDRYGWVPLPYAIEQEEFERVLSYIEDKELLNEWYQLDTNQIPASYIIKERSGEYEDFTQWSEVESKLRSLLQSGVEKTDLSQEQKRKYFLSATEEEVIEGVLPYLTLTPFQKEQLLKENPSLTEIDHKHILGFLRDIDRSTQVANKFITDDYEKAQKFKEKVAVTLPKRSQLHLTTKQVDEKHLDESYLEVFQTRVTAFLKEQIDMQHREADVSSPLEVELAAQAYYAANKRKSFLGQRAIREVIDNYIENVDTKEPFVLYGKSGSGKSALMAKSIEEAENRLQQRVLYRFVSVTPNSSSSKEILISLFDELGKDIRGDEEENFEEFSNRVYEEIKSIEENIVIFIDAVDQLQNDDNFLWLPQQLPSNVKIVISALSDENYQEDSKYLESLRTKTETLHKIPPFSEAKELLKKLLTTYHRRVTPIQENYFLQQYVKVSSPLYVTIAVQEMKYWKSSDSNQELEDTQRGIIKEFISNLSEFKHHDEVFVRRVLGYIYASRDGLSESELLQLLSQDEVFIEKMAPEDFHKNVTKELPLIHWSRLHTELKPFLNLKKVDNEELLYFFHREFEDVVANKTEQQQEHDSIIKATQKLILKNQDKAFDANRWGKLYITLITEYELRYHNKEKQKEFAFFLADTKHLREEWIDECLFELNEIGFAHNEYNRMYKAIAYQESALYIIQELYKKNPNYWISIYILTLGNLAVSYSQHNHINEAIELNKKVLTLSEKLYERDNPDNWAKNYTRTLINLSSLYKDKNHINEAIELEEKALMIQELLYQEYPDRWARYYVTTLNNLAGSYNNQNRFNEAIKLLEQSLLIIEEFYKDNPNKWARNYTRILLNLASSFRDQNYLNKAIELEEKALKIQKTLVIIDPSRWTEDYTITLNNLAASYSKQKHFYKAIKLQEQSLIIIEKLYEDDSIRWAKLYTTVLSNLATSYRNLVFSYKKQNSLDEVKELEERLVKIQEKLYQENPDYWSEDYSISLDNFAGSLAKIKDYKTASQYYEIYFKVVDFNLQDDIVWFIYPFIKWYQCEFRLGNVEGLVQLEELAKKLITLYKNKLGSDYDDIIAENEIAYREFAEGSDDLVDKEKYDLFMKIFYKEKE